MAGDSWSDIRKRIASFDWASWSDALREKFEPIYRQALDDAGDQAAADAGGEWENDDPFVQRFATKYVGERIKQLEGFTRENVTDIVRRTFDEQGGADRVELTNAIRDAVRETYAGYETWRAARIARTESAIVENNAQALGYAQAGVNDVGIQDGTGDDECAEANGQTWTVEEYLADPIAHPNCVRDAFPIIDEAQRRVHAWERLTRDVDVDALASVCAVAAHLVAGKDDPCGRDLLIADDDPS